MNNTLEIVNPLHKNVSILLVEDNDIDAMGVKRAFAREKIDNPLHRAEDGVAALELLRSSDSRQIRQPRIMLVDINMPRMNGLEFIAALRQDETLKRSIVFVLTTSKSKQDQIDAYNLNIAGYIIKDSSGSDMAQIVDMLRHYCDTVELPDTPRIN